MLILTLLVSLVLPVADDPGTHILRAFDTHRVVALGENHGHAELHALVLNLLRRDDAARVIDDIVIEWGNARYQDVVDRYTSGMDVPWDSVTMAWRNTIVSPNTVWDAPVYGRFFEEIRAMNLRRSPELRYRVVLADPAVDWDVVSGMDDLRPFFDRAAHMADVLRRESLLKGRRALFVAGGLHVTKLPRRRLNSNGVPVGEITPVAWIELRNPGSVYVIQSMARAERLGLDSLQIQGEPLAVQLSERPDLSAIPANDTTTLRDRDGTRADVYGRLTLGDIVDAVILWDPADVTLQDADPAAYEVDWYWEALNRRSQMLRGGPMDPGLRGQ